MQSRFPPVGMLPLMLLPGTLCDDRLFAEIIEAAGRRPVLIGNMYGLTSIAALSRKLLESAPPHFALTGFSLGGIVALEMAAIAPDRIAGLALIGSNARNVPAAAHHHRRAAVRHGGSIGDYVRQQLWPSYVAYRNRGASQLLDVIVSMAEASPANALDEQTEVALTRTDSRSRLNRYAKPTLILAGAEDALAPPHLQQEMADAFPNARLELIADAGHFVLLEQPAATASALRSWLERVDLTSVGADTQSVEAV